MLSVSQIIKLLIILELEKNLNSNTKTGIWEDEKKKNTGIRI
ncbi:hypothetical protein SAMN04489724_4642 [Algoriphagus locisalis]|uniref:Uncharacterized protein n=1 Tax=Algoriphagus locisalis TaxID=305507 RepID=A0A1I7E0D0_9BACT|nr:hypothetical protein SAMN04489724_4642 [Algoriphagus locisalis]